MDPGPSRRVAVPNLGGVATLSLAHAQEEDGRGLAAAWGRSGGTVHGCTCTFSRSLIRSPVCAGVMSTVPLV